MLPEEDFGITSSHATSLKLGKRQNEKEREKGKIKGERVHERVVLCIKKIFRKPYTEILIAVICISLE